MSLTNSIEDLVRKIGFYTKCLSASPSRSAEHANAALTYLNEGSVFNMDGVQYRKEAGGSALDDLNISGITWHGVQTPTHLGATGDGITDDSAAFMRLVSSGDVFIRKGNYKLNSGITTTLTGDLSVQAEGGVKLTIGSKQDHGWRFNTASFDLEVCNIELDLDYKAPYGFITTNLGVTMNEASNVVNRKLTVKHAVAETGEFGAALQVWGAFNKAQTLECTVDGVHFDLLANPTGGVHSIRGIAFSSSDGGVSFPKDCLVSNCDVSNIYALDETLGMDQDAVAYIGDQLDSRFVVEGTKLSNFNTRGVKTKSQNTLVEDCTFELDVNDLGTVRAQNPARHFVDLQGAGGRVVGNCIKSTEVYAQDFVQVVWNSADGTYFECSRNVLEQTAHSTSDRIVFLARYFPYNGYRVGNATISNNIVRDLGSSNISELVSVRVNGSNTPTAKIHDNVIDDATFDLVSVITQNADAGVTGAAFLDVVNNRVLSSGVKLVFDSPEVLGESSGNVGFTSSSGLFKSYSMKKFCDSNETVSFPVLDTSIGDYSAVVSLVGTYGSNTGIDLIVDRWNSASSAVERWSGSLVEFGGTSSPNPEVSGKLNIWFDNSDKTIKVKNLLPSWDEKLVMTVVAKGR